MSITMNLLKGLAIAGFSANCLANVVTSNDAPCSAGTARIFSITASNVLSCLTTGSGNINGGNGGQADTAFVSSGWTFLDNTSDSGGLGNGWLTGSDNNLTSGLDGSFSINPSAFLSYQRIAIGFKSGNGQSNPDWAIFELAPNTLSGLWSISGQQALSHAMLYGRGTPTHDVPEPGVLALLGIALSAAAIAVSGRRRLSTSPRPAA